MAKRINKTEQTTAAPSAADASRSTTADTLEQRVVAFAEQLGRVAGTVHAKAEGWMDRETLSRQISSVRDAAVEMLQQLAGGTTNASKVSEAKPAAAAPRRGSKGRSGGVVDAPGKKHRAPMPTDPGETIVDSQAAKMRTAKTMVKTNRRRGRG
jgi:hypothetical protein